MGVKGAIYYERAYGIIKRYIGHSSLGLWVKSPYPYPSRKPSIPNKRTNRAAFRTPLYMQRVFRDSQWVHLSQIK